jgi:hypothetical protein
VIGAQDPLKDGQQLSEKVPNPGRIPGLPGPSAGSRRAAGSSIPRRPPGTSACKGGTSSSKKNAPTIEVILNQSRPVTGWLAAHPKDLNVGFWCAVSKVLASWRYTLTAEPGSRL